MHMSVQFLSQLGMNQSTLLQADICRGTNMYKTPDTRLREVYSAASSRAAHPRQRHPTTSTSRTDLIH